MFGDTQADEGGLFPDENFVSVSWVTEQIADISEHIRRLEAKLEVLRNPTTNTYQTTLSL